MVSCITSSGGQVSADGFDSRREIVIFTFTYQSAGSFCVVHVAKRNFHLKLIFHFISLQQKLDKIFSSINLFTMFFYAFLIIHQKHKLLFFTQINVEF